MAKEPIHDVQKHRDEIAEHEARGEVARIGTKFMRAVDDFLDHAGPDERAALRTARKAFVAALRTFYLTK